MKEKEKEEILKCSICGNNIPNYFGWKYGNNAWPINDGRCCNDCNEMYVIPARCRINTTK